MDSEHVCSVQKENGLGFYRVHSIWSNEGLRINIASKDASWSGQVSRNKLEETSKHLDQQPGLYVDECKAALTTDDGLPGLAYAVENGSFVWKKTIDEELGIKVQLGSIPLEPVSFVDTIQKMLDVAISSKVNVTKLLEQSNLDKTSAELNLTQMFEKLDACEIKSNNMENDLMHNFVRILNSKKCRISELEQKVCMLKAERPKKNAISRKKVKVPNPDPYDVDTDDEMPIAVEPSELKPSMQCASKGDSKGTVPNKPPTSLQSENASHPTRELESSSVAASNDTQCDASKEESSEAIPSKSTDILDFFFGTDG